MQSEILTQLHASKEDKKKELAIACIVSTPTSKQASKEYLRHELGRLAVPLAQHPLGLELHQGAPALRRQDSRRQGFPRARGALKEHGARAVGLEAGAGQAGHGVERLAILLKGGGQVKEWAEWNI
jgi:hypothetical protein